MSKQVRIGVDIGASAVRAAEVVVDGDRRVLRRFAQVGLPTGAVVEGEVHDGAAVTSALKKLWQHGRFSGKRVIVGLGSQRGMVRQVEMPQMSDGELKSALRFKMGEFLPIPVEQAVVDFAPLPNNGATDTRRVLLVAAQREVVVDEVSAVEGAGLRVVAVDSSSLALLRAAESKPGPASGGPGGGLEAVIGVGSELVTVAVREGGVPRFVRTIALTGPAGTRIGSDGGTSASSIGRSVPRKTGGIGVAPAPRLDAIVNEVRSSLEYLLSQSGTASFEQVLLTGGGAMLPGLIEGLAAAVGAPVTVAKPALEIDKAELGLEETALDEAAYRWLTCVGLALWGTDAYGKPSLLPSEVEAKRNQQRVLITAAAGLLVVVFAMGSVSLDRLRTASSINANIESTKSESASLQQRIDRLGFVIRVPQEMQSRRLLASEALTGDIDWLGALQNIESAMPAGVQIESLILQKTTSTVSGANEPAPTSGSTGTIVGNVSITAKTTGRAKAVSAFIDRLSHDKDLYTLWVSSTTNGNGTTSINATAQLTSAALSKRAAALPGGSK